RVANKMRNAFRMLGYEVTMSESPVVPVFIGDQIKCFRLWNALYENGVFANPVIPPAVEPGHALMRTSYIATHTDAQLDRAIEQLYGLGKKFKVLPQDSPSAAAVIAKVGSVDAPGADANRFVASAPGNAAWARKPEPARTPAELARKVFGLVESATWRAANL